MKRSKPESYNLVLPPYGFHNDEYLMRLARAIVPGDWRGAPGSTQTPDEQWIDCRTKTLALIHEVLWPARVGGDWVGASAAFMNELTETDLQLMLDMQRRKVFDQPISPPGATKSSPTHRQLFFVEDQGTVPFNQYDPTLEFRLLNKIPFLWTIGLPMKTAGSSVPLQFKVVLQRPRAYQTALLMGHDDFTYEQALSADTPSMCSGHCLQGTLVIGSVIERFLLDKEKLKPHDWHALEQWAVDVGDRRVLAGVHYPSDNLCSWLIAMRMADRVYRTAEVRRKLWHGISTRSVIYQNIQRWVKLGYGDVYKPALLALQAAAAGKANC